MRLGPYLILLLVPLVPLVEDQADRIGGAAGPREEVLYLWSGEHVRRLFPGFEDVMADIYWLRTVQYFGAQRLFSTERKFDLLRPLIEIATTLDPRLEIAYRYGAVFLCEPWPVGKGDSEAGIAVLEKGVKALPRSWRMRQDLGYFRYIFLHDAQGGARTLLEAAKLPGAPFWLETLAGGVLVEGGQRRTAREVWRRMYDQAEGAILRDNAAYHLQQLDALDAIDALNAAAARFEERHGRRPTGGQELAAPGGVDRRLLVDPAGVPFEYDAARNRFWFARRSRYWRGPE